MSSQTRSAFAHYAQSQTNPASVALNATGLIAASRVSFSLPIDVVRVGLIQNGSAIDAGIVLTWNVVDQVGGSSVIRTSGTFTTTALAGGDIKGFWADLDAPLRVDPGEEVVVDVVSAGGVGQTALLPFMYRSYGWNSPGELDQDGNAVAIDRLVNMTEVPLA